jgi:hypothetical protein
LYGERLAAVPRRFVLFLFHIALALHAPVVGKADAGIEIRGEALAGAE